MPTISLTKTYQDGNVLTEQDLDNVRVGVQDALNTTKLDSANIQAGGITGANIASNTITASNMAANSIVTAAITDANVTTAKIADAAVTAAKLATGAGRVAGEMVMYGGTAAPTGWLLCDGTSYLRTDYAALFSAIGTAFGAADGTHFNVPDMRGRFPRGVDGTAGVDPDKALRTAMNTGGNTGNNVGSVQTDQLISHSHDIREGSTGSATGSVASGNDNGAPAYSSAVQPTGGNETRPKNAYVHFIIKT